jgi:hypothetical protein
MVFDIRGRRKHVVRVVYAILALLMGASLFLVVGPFNLGNLLGRGSSTSASSVLVEQAERIEKKLNREPDNEALLVSLTRSRIGAGNAMAETNPETGASVTTAEGRASYERALESWNRYLKQATSPNPSAAALVAGTYFRIAESSGSLEEAEKNIEGAAGAQRIAAKASPSVGTLSTLAIYEYYAGDFAAGDKAAKQVVAKTPSSEEAKEVKKQLAEFRARGKQFEEKKKEFAKLEKKQGKEALKNPFGGLAGSTGTLGQ